MYGAMYDGPEEERDESEDLDRPFIVQYETTISLAAKVTASDEDDAIEQAGTAVEAYLNTLRGDSVVLAAYATIDGLAATEVAEA